MGSQSYGLLIYLIIWWRVQSSDREGQHKGGCVHNAQAVLWPCFQPDEGEEVASDPGQGWLLPGSLE